jgi:hypothetical protein
MFRLVVVLLSVGLAMRGGAARGHGGHQSHGRGQQGQTCENALLPCQIRVLGFYPTLLSAASDGPEAILEAITTSLTTTPITSHCTNLKNISTCALDVMDSSVCRRNHAIRTYLPTYKESRKILDFTCEPENARILQANIRCFTDQYMIASLESCGEQVGTAISNAYPDTDEHNPAACRAALSTFKSAAQECVGQRINAAPICRSASSTGGTGLAQAIVGKVLDVAEEHMHLCPTSYQQARDLMSLHKKYFEEIYRF